MSEKLKLQRFIENQLRDLQDGGYIIHENNEHEVAIAINVTAHNIVNAAESIYKADEFILLDGNFYSKRGIKDHVKAKELS